MLAASVYLIVLRFIHIGAGIAWAGSVFLFVLFVQPSAAAIAPAGAPFMRELLMKRKTVDKILMIAGTSLAGGLLLYWNRWHARGSFGDWIGWRYGLAMTIGGVSAIVGFLVGLLGTRPNVGRLMALGAEIAQAGGEPSPEQGAEMKRLQGVLRMFAKTSLGFIAVAVLMMSTAQYW